MGGIYAGSSMLAPRSVIVSITPTHRDLTLPECPKTPLETLILSHSYTDWSKDTARLNKSDGPNESTETDKKDPSGPRCGWERRSEVKADKKDYVEYCPMVQTGTFLLFLILKFLANVGRQTRKPIAVILSVVEKVTRKH